MPKYRLLTLDELNELEKEFIDFLVVNSIAPEDWQRIKNEDRGEAVVEQFSDVVFETIMRKVSYLEFRDEKNVMAYHCLSDKLILVGVLADKESEVNFCDPSYLQMAFMNPPASLKVYTSEKDYSKVRELELFGMIEGGCTIADDKLFKSLCMALPAK